MTNVYIAGPITGDPNYKEKFDAVEKKLQALGFCTYNPAHEEEGLEYREYINRGLFYLERCELICMLPGSPQSKGATLERAYAKTVDMPVLKADFYGGEWHIIGCD